MFEGMVRGGLAELALWDVLLDLCDSLTKAGAAAHARCATQDEFESAWRELVHLVFSTDSSDLVWERYRQFEADSGRAAVAEVRRAQWLKRRAQEKKPGGAEQ